MRRWLAEQGWLDGPVPKPNRPKEAFQAALHEARVARSASLYRRLAERVSVRRCTDRGFQELRNTLRRWFPPRRPA